MAQKFEESLFFQQICEAAENKKCFKSLLESLCDSREWLFLQKFTDLCKNVEKKLKKFEQSKQQAQSVRDTLSRDDILYNLNTLREIFSCAERKQSICPLFFEFLRTISKESLLIVLKSCLNNCHDHFIAFQSYKLLCNVYKCFPNLVLCVPFEELINMSLLDDNEACGQWLPVYTAGIIKEVFVVLESCDEVSNPCESASSSQLVCRCEFDDKNSKGICAGDIRDSLCFHWLKLTNHYSAKLSMTLQGKSSPMMDSCKATLNTCQQILTTMLSCGKTIFKSCDFFSANQKLADIDTKAEKTVENLDLPTGETSKNAKHASTEDQSLSTDDSKCQIAFYKVDSIAQSICDGSVSSTHNCQLKLFENIIIELLKIDRTKCLLHLNRTVLQFFNDIVDVIQEHCFDKEKTNFSPNTIGRCVRICSVLMENSKVLFGSVPQVTGNVHFGGQDRGVEQGELSGWSYDKVSSRKVLLLVLKLMLVTLRTQSESSKFEQLHALKLPLESWSYFVTKISSHSSLQSAAVWLVHLFSDQDDDLVSLLFSLLILYQRLFHNESSQTTPDWVNQLQISLNPHGFFVEFLTSISYDHSLLLDFLISNETNFLPYFHMYLRHLANDWCGFISVVEQGENRLLSETLKPLSSDSDDICDVCSNGGKVSSVGNSGVVGGDCGDKHGNNSGSSNNGGSDGEDGNMRDVDGGDGDVEDVGSVGGDNICIDDGDGGINDYGNSNVSGVGGNSVGDDDGDDNDMEDVGNKGGVNIGFKYGDGGGNDGNGNVGDVGTDGGSNVGDGDGGDMGDVGSDDGDMEDVGSNGGDNVGVDGNSGSSDGNSNMGGDVGSDSDGGNSVGADDSDDGNSGDGVSFSGVGHCGDDDDGDVNGGNDSNCDSVGGSSDNDVVMCNISNLQKTLTCLIRLRYAIERMSSKGLFPYPVTPLVKLMEYIEALYETEG